LASLFASSGELAFFFTQTFNNVLVDPRISLQVPLTNELSFCPEGATNCSAFYFPGGFEYIADNPPFFSEVSDEDVIVFKNTQGLLIGFWQLPLSDLENGINADVAVCQIYGYEEAAFEICLGPSIENDAVWIACSIPHVTGLMNSGCRLSIRCDILHYRPRLLGKFIQLWNRHVLVLYDFGYLLLRQE
jgi:hypothetical protein